MDGAWRKRILSKAFSLLNRVVRLFAAWFEPVTEACHRSVFFLLGADQFRLYWYGLEHRRCCCR